MLAAVGVWIGLPTGVQAQNGVGTGPVSTVGIVTAESSPAVDAAARALSGSPTAVLVDSSVDGSLQARRSLIAGEADFVISGVPFTDAERAELDKTGRRVIAAPVQAVGLQLFGFVPPLSIFPKRCEDPEAPDCDFSSRTSYTGRLRFTPATVAALFFERSNIWTRPDVSANLDIDQQTQFLFPPITGARPLVRSDADAFNYYLDQYIALTQPAVRQAYYAPASDPTAPQPPPSEAWLSSTTPSKQTMDQGVAVLSAGIDPASSQQSLGGAVMAAAPSFVSTAFLLNAAKPAAEQVPIFAAQVQNAAGEWLDPTPQSITAAIAAGNGAPLAGAAGTPVPGAYPVSWVNQLYAPSSGLTADQANAVATIIRWLVGSGRASAGDRMEGRVTDAMVATSLKAANQIVESNCVSAKGTVYEADDGGPFAPGGGLGVGGPMKLCKGPADPAVAAGSDPSSAVESAADSASGGTFDAGSSYSGSEGFSELSPSYDPAAALGGPALDQTGASAGGSAGAGSASGGATGQRVAVRRNMPLPIPGLTLSPLDRAVTLAIGAGIFIVLRSLYERRGAAP